MIWPMVLYNAVSVCVFGYATFNRGHTMWIWTIHVVLAFLLYVECRVAIDKWERKNSS